MNNSRKRLLFLLPMVLFVAAACNSPKQTTPTNNQPQTQQPSTTYLVIKEWDVEFEKPADMQDLQYIDFVHDGTSMAFGTQQLANLDASTTTGKQYCAIAQAPIGILARTKDLSTFGDHYIPTNVKLGDYYYWFTGPQATCSADKQVQQLQTQQMHELSTSILKTLKITE